MEKDSRIYIAGHRGLVGSAILRYLRDKKYTNLVYRTRKELDLLNQKKVKDFFQENKPEYIFLAAAKVGGIMANKDYPADFIYSNLQIQNNIIHNSYKNKVKKLLFLGSSCIYPKFCKQPIKEEYLLDGKLEPTNEAYAIAKIAGIKMCQSYNKQFATNFISVMPTNLYGSGDNFDLDTSHVLPALIRRFYEAKLSEKNKVVLWGTGNPKREFLYIDDLVKACVFLMEEYNETEVVNIGTGEDVSIKELAGMIQKIVGYVGEIEWDRTKPDGTPRKLLDVRKINQLGWRASTKLFDGITVTYKWFLEKYGATY